MLDALVSTAWKRPWALLLGALALLAALLLIASGVRGALGYPTADPDRSEVLVVTRADEALGHGVYTVALEAIRARIAAKPEVSRVAVVREPGGEGRAALRVEMDGVGAADRRQVADEIAGEIDPGPLQVRVGGGLAELVAAEDSVLDDLWRLELLIVPLAVLALIAAMGVRLAAGPPLCAAIAGAGAVAGLALAGYVTELSLLAVVPAVVVALVLGVELAALLAARWEDETRLGQPLDALQVAFADGMRGAWFAAGAALLAALAAVAPYARDAFEPGVSFAFGVGLAAAAAALACAIAMPPLLALAGRSPRDADGEPGSDGRLAGVLAAIPRALAAGPVRCAVGVAVALVAGVALGYPALEAATAPLGDPAAPDLLVRELPLAGGIAVLVLATGFAARTRSLRVAPFALSALPAPLAALGVATLAFHDGVEILGVGIAPRTPTTGAVAVALLALCAISAARTASAMDAVSAERELDPGPAGVSERAGQLTLPAAALATLLGVAAFGVLAGAELRPAQELGAMIGVGLLVDLVIVRAPVLAALARWGVRGADVADPGSRTRIRWRPRWRRRTQPGTVSPS